MLSNIHTKERILNVIFYIYFVNINFKYIETDESFVTVVKNCDIKNEIQLKFHTINESYF